jgi:hypothetical protein
LGVHSKAPFGGDFGPPRKIVHYPLQIEAMLRDFAGACGPDGENFACPSPCLWTTVSGPQAFWLKKEARQTRQRPGE